jgi:hypothetical protein
MPLYDAWCRNCGWEGEIQVSIFHRDTTMCGRCNHILRRKMAAPLGRIAGQAVQGGGPDRFTADALGIPLHDLPDSLRAEPKKKDG